MDLDCSLSSLGYSFLSHSIAPHFRRHEPGNWQPGPPLSLMVDIRSLSACSIGATDPSPSRGPRSAFRPGMRKGTLAVKTLLLYLPSGSSWSSAFRPRLEIPAGAPTTTTVVAWPSGRLDSRFLSRMSCFGADAINLDEIWPQLAGKNTCANEAAGKVIREAWAGELGKTTDAAVGKDWSVRREVVEYSDGEMSLQGLYARPVGEGVPERIPGVVLAHTAVGPQEDFILWKLDAIARLGYAAFALDMFGTGRALWDRSESLAARRPITEDRSLLQVRANAALHTLSTLEGVDPDRLAAVGYCFGGMAVLDLARMGPAATPGLKAVASLHGILVPILPGCQGDADMEDAKIGPRVVVLHATGDPFVPPEQVQAMEQEFTRRGANLEIVRYGGSARHAFTRPEKTGQAERDAGFSYDEHADVDSWRRVVDLLRDEFS